jgi:uncharacterized protein involved in exopolysaccharide biosynthesis/Mrp family chromosome partitioning ATPase
MKREEATSLALRGARSDLPARFVAAPADAESERGPTLPMRLHALLRGRYHWAVLLSTLLAAAGAYAGYRATRPTYKSNVVIKIEPVLPRILYKSESNDPLPAFDTFVNTQVALLKGGGVLDRAYASEAWQAVPEGQRHERRKVAKNLMITAPVSTRGVIEIEYTDISPEGAQAGAQSIFEAYNALYGNRDEKALAQKLQILETRKASLDLELTAYNKQILTLAREMGSDALEDTYKFKLNEANKLESEWMDTKVALTLAEAALRESQRPDRPPVALTADEVAKLDLKMQDLLKLRREEAIKLDNMRIHYKEHHPRLVDAKKALRQLDDKIDARVKEFSASRTAAVVDNGATGDNSAASAVPAVLRVEQLKLKEERLAELARFAKADAEALGRKNITIKQLKMEAEDVKKRLDETVTRIEELDVESVVGGRVTVVTPSELPYGAFKDSRLKMSIAGGGAGWMLGLGLVMLVGALDSRVKRLHDLREGGVLAPILGIVPVLPPGGKHAELAAASVHRIRALLQVSAGWEGRRVIAVTSPAAGTGKTSLTVGLGVSFAMSGTKTLLIDCDLTGGGLRARMKDEAKKKGKQPAGKIAWNPDMPSDGAPFGLDATMADLGYIAPEDDLDRMLATLDAKPVGLMGVMQGRLLRECVKPTHIENLSILPSLGLDGKDVSRISPGFLRGLILEAKQQYDMILIDTGPIPDSVEGAISAAAADAVILNVCRGQHGGEVTDALQHLESIGVRAAGLVFNRADPRDAVSNPVSYRGKVKKPATRRRRNAPRVRPTSAEEIFGSGILAMAVSDRSHKNGGAPSNGGEARP